jgi:transcription-repair coupling factor (superfamily II helicase)
MTFTSVLENIARSPIATKIGEKLKIAKNISLSGLSRLGKGLISTHLCQQQTKPLLIVTATVEEATRWALQLQSMSWRVYLYQPLDTFPYESAQIDLETAWTRIEILAELLAKPQHNLAITTTINALQPHLPSTQVFQKHSIYLNIGDSQSVKLLASALARLGYAEVKEVKESKQWSRKGFSFEVFPVNRNLPVRLSCNRGTVEKIREFDPNNPKSFTDLSSIAIAPVDLHEFVSTHKATLLHYLPKNFIVAIDEPEQCQSYGDRWYEAADELYQNQHPQADTPKLHWEFAKCMTEAKKFQMLQLTERSLIPQTNDRISSQHKQRSP